MNLRVATAFAPTILALLLSVGSALTGCTTPDPEGRLGDFEEARAAAAADAAQDSGTGDTAVDTGEDTGSGSGVTCTPAPFEVEGTYLLGVNVFPLDRRDEYPLLLSTEIVADGSGTYTFTFQPLATDDIIADDGSRTPRTTGARAPVGTAIVVSGVTIGDDRSFNLTVAGLRIVGEANSLTGRDILADINFVNATFRDSNFACGDVTGQASEPISLSLAPSTFAFQRTTDFLSATFLADNCNDAAEIPAPAEICEGCTPAPFEAIGTYLLGVNVFPLDRRDEHPLLISTEIAADGSGSYTFTFQPLATDDIIADDGSRTPRTTGARAPAGTPIVVTGVTIGDDRSFNLTVAGLRIIGEANSLTGRDILADINFVDASFRDSNFACGNVTGQASEPISLSLAPSTFALQRATDFLSATFLADACNDAEQIPAPPEDCGEGSGSGN
jgi:hypothetical protein